MQAENTEVRTTHLWLLRAAGGLAVLASVALVAFMVMGWPPYHRLSLLLGLWAVVLPAVGGSLVLLRPRDTRLSAVGAFLVLVAALPFMAATGSPLHTPVLALLGVAVLIRVRRDASLRFVTLEQKAAREVLIVFGAALLAPVLLALGLFNVTIVTFLAAVGVLYSVRVLLWAWQAATAEAS